MSANWKAGDRAVCVDISGGAGYIGPRPSLGTVYLVADVLPSFFAVGELAFRPSGIDLGITAQGEPRRWGLIRFRKLVPACDRATIEQEATA